MRYETDVRQRQLSIRTQGIDSGGIGGGIIEGQGINDGWIKIWIIECESTEDYIIVGMCN